MDTLLRAEIQDMPPEDLERAEGEAYFALVTATRCSSIWLPLPEMAQAIKAGLGKETAKRLAEYLK